MKMKSGSGFERITRNKKQKRFIARIHKHKKDAAGGDGGGDASGQSAESKMEVEPAGSDGDHDVDEFDDLTSLDSEERNAINSDDEMKKLEDFESELREGMFTEHDMLGLKGFPLCC